MAFTLRARLGVQDTDHRKRATRRRDLPDAWSASAIGGPGGREGDTVKGTFGMWLLVAIVLVGVPETASGDAKPATKVTADLADLYQAHAAAVATGVPFATRQSLLPVAGDLVTSR